ncbi:MAG TPA: tetratricopeptide repeat protein [Thermoanaerobaculia bacterium]
MRLLSGVIASFLGAGIFIVGLVVAQSQSEARILSAMQSIVYGLVIAAGFALVMAGFRYARWAAVVVDAGTLFFFFTFVYPSVFTSLGRSLQTRTMADLRSIAVALEDRAGDTNEYPRVRAIGDLAPLLEPTYVKRMPRTDAWGQPWRYESWEDHYAIASAGRDRKFDRASLRQYPRTSTTSFDGDLVYRDGELISGPDFVMRSDPKALFDQATALYKSDRYREAIPIFERYLRSNPNDALANARLGLSLAQAGELQDSIPYLQKAIAADPTDYQSRSNLGLVYEKLNRPEEGIEWERKAVAIKPNDPVVLNNLGFVLMRSGHNAEAVTVFQRAVRLAPNEKLYRENLAQAKKNAALRPPF